MYLGIQLIIQGKKTLGIFIHEKFVTVFQIDKIRFIYLQFLAFNQQNLTKTLRSPQFPVLLLEINFA